MSDNTSAKPPGRTRPIGQSGNPIRTKVQGQGRAVLGATLLGAAASVAGAADARAIEEPAYTLVLQDGAIEIRDYAPTIVAEVLVEADRSRASSAGFQPLADYIFGANAPRQSIEMTAPVTTQAAPVKIDMTAPVTQTQAEDGRWLVRFVMPSEWTMETLPAPTNPSVALIETPPQRVAAIRYSGSWRAASQDAKTAELMSWITAQDLVVAGPPIYAGYNPPWTPPFLRRNEVMIPLAAPSSTDDPEVEPTLR